MLVAISTGQSDAGTPDNAAHLDTVRILTRTYDLWGNASSMIFFCLGALLLNFLLYRSGLVPPVDSGVAADKRIQGTVGGAHRSGNQVNAPLKLPSDCPAGWLIVGGELLRAGWAALMRWVFVGTPGFLGRVEGPTRCAFWSEDPQGHGFDPGRLVAVDLARTPSAAAAGMIGREQVQVDDCFTGPNGAVAGTTIGPAWPELRMSGAVYLEQRFVASLPVELRPLCPPTGASGRVYECLTTVYWPQMDDPRAGTRYAGHHAQIIDERDTLAHVAIWPPGRSGDPAGPAARMWIDLASPVQCDAGPDSLTTIGVGDAPKHGALFLISGHLTYQGENP